jgi:hypothetical protein
MTDSQLQKKLNQLVKLTNEIDAEITSRHGTEGFLFYESEGSFHVMDGDENGGGFSDRTDHIQMSSEGVSRLQCGSW